MYDSATTLPRGFKRKRVQSAGGKARWKGNRKRSVSKKPFLVREACYGPEVVGQLERIGVQIMNSRAILRVQELRTSPGHGASVRRQSPAQMENPRHG
jgi:hypothetical protein